MKSLQNNLPHYFQILKHKRIPNYIFAKYTSVSFDRNESTEQLWKLHHHTLLAPTMKDVLPKTSLLDLKIELANRMYHNCNFCHHNCLIDREKTEGFCKIQEFYIASAFIHKGEESILVPSYTVFFSGCNFHCMFCQNYDISQNPKKGKKATEVNLTQLISKLPDHIKNINWVGGEPTPHLLFILESLKHLDIVLPQIWNSNMYCSQETMALLDGIIDLYLTDFKFGNNTCAMNVSGVKKYWEVITRNHITALNQGDVLIRHLLLPSHLSCCSKKIIQWIGKHMQTSVVHIMDQYYPTYKSTCDTALNSTISRKEYSYIMHFAEKHHLFLYID